MTSPRPFRFGIQVTRAPSAADWTDTVRKIEDLGYSSLLLPDHYASNHFAPMVALAHAAAVTDRLRLGSLVFGNDFRHPVVLAKEAATLDLLSEGRLELGLGAGWMQVDYDRLGLPLDPPRERIARLAEAVKVVKGGMTASWSGAPFDFAGEHYNVAGLQDGPVPVQRPHPPITLGGGGPVMLRLAGAEADIIGIGQAFRRGDMRGGIGVITQEAMEDTVGDATTRKLQWIREGAGDRFDEIELQSRYFLVSVTDDRRGYAEGVAAQYGMSAEQVTSSGVFLAGTVDEICETLQQRRQAWGVSYIVVGSPELDDFAPVVARLTDT